MNFIQPIVIHIFNMIIINKNNIMKEKKKEKN